MQTMFEELMAEIKVVIASLAGGVTALLVILNNALG
jgi:hypothetical protein